MGRSDDRRDGGGHAGGAGHKRGRRGRQGFCRHDHMSGFIESLPRTSTTTTNATKLTFAKAIIPRRKGIRGKAVATKEARRSERGFEWAG